MFVSNASMTWLLLSCCFMLGHATGHLRLNQRAPPERRTRLRAEPAQPSAPALPSASDKAGALLEQDACIGLRMMQEVDTKFAKRPPSDTILPRLSDAVGMGTVRQCNSDIVFHGMTGLSLVEMFLHLANYLTIASYFNASFVWSQPDAYNAVWAAYFQNALGLAMPACRSAGHENELVHAHDWTEKLAQDHQAYMFRVKSSILRHLWTLWSESRATIHDTLSKVGIDAQTKFIGIDLPGLELHLKIAEAGQSNTSIVGQIRHLMKRENITVIYAVRRGDESKESSNASNSSGVAPSSATASRSVTSLLQKHVGSQVQWLNLVNKQAKLRQEKLQPYSAFSVLTVVEALKRSHVFVGASDSNVSHLVFHLRQPGTISVKFDMEAVTEQLQMQA